MNSEEYKNGQLTTDFLKRYGMVERLEDDIKNEKKEKQIPAIASAIMYSEFFQSIVKSQNSLGSSWKSRMGGA